LRTIAVANHKGGVGKTTTAANLAAGLARAGHRTLLVDADAQAQASYFFVDDLAAVEADLQDVIVAHRAPVEVVVRTRVEGLDLLPATLSLAQLDMQLVAMAKREDRVRMGLAPLAERYEFAVVDLAPSLAPLTLSALVAADEIVVPVNPTRFAMLGLGTFLGWVQEYRELDVIHGRLLGILVTMWDGHLRIARQVQATLDELPVRRFESLIPKRTAAEDQAEARLVVGDPGASEDLSAAYSAFTEEVLSLVTEAVPA